MLADRAKALHARGLLRGERVPRHVDRDPERTVLCLGCGHPRALRRVRSQGACPRCADVSWGIAANISEDVLAGCVMRRRVSEYGFTNFPLSSSSPAGSPIPSGGPAITYAAEGDEEL